MTDVFVRAFRSLPSFRGDCLFSTWLHRITVNAALNAKSRRPADTASLDDPTIQAAVPVSNPQAMIEGRERRRTVRRAVRELSPKLRSVVVLHYFEGWTCEQIADVLNISVGTVWSRLNAAKAKLAERLRGERLKSLLQEAGTLEYDGTMERPAWAKVRERLERVQG